MAPRKFAKKMSMWMGAFLALGLACESAHSAPNSRILKFQSKWDTFVLTIQNGKGEVDGQPADFSIFKELTAVLNSPLGTACPSLAGKPADITVHEGTQVRSIYIDRGIVSDGKNCMNVGGEGLYYFPIHRDFLIGKKNSRVGLRSPVKIFHQGVKLVELKNANDEWEVEGSDLLINWEFIRKFEWSLKDFRIRSRIHPDLALGKPKMIVRSSGDTYEFYKMTEIMWAMKVDKGWLVASDDWSFWGDLDRKQIEDPYAEQIRFLLGPDAGDEQKKTAVLQKLDGVWSSNLRDLYHKLALSIEEPLSVRLTALRRLRRKPALVTAGVALEVLEGTEDAALQHEAFSILRTQNPKGPRLQPRMTATQRAQVLAKWRSWWERLPKKKD